MTPLVNDNHDLSLVIVLLVSVFGECLSVCGMCILIKVVISPFHTRPIQQGSLAKLQFGCTILQTFCCVNGHTQNLLSRFFCQIYCPSFLAKSCHTLLQFTTLLKLSKGLELNCCRVNRTIEVCVEVFVAKRSNALGSISICSGKQILLKSLLLSKLA